MLGYSFFEFLADVEDEVEDGQRWSVCDSLVEHYSVKALGLFEGLSHSMQVRIGPSKLERNDSESRNSVCVTCRSGGT